MMSKPSNGAREAAESLAAQALNYIAQSPERLGRFLALSGLDAGSIRCAAADSGFLGGVLSHLGEDEQLLRSFADETGVAPAEVDRARRILTGGDWEPEVP